MISLFTMAQIPASYCVYSALRTHAPSKVLVSLLESSVLMMANNERIVGMAVRLAR
jgi:hypothetical protein